jgi:Protein of unknown function (DUF2946)
MRRIAKGGLSSLVTFVTVVSLLVRLSLPVVAAPVATVGSDGATLTALGAALCHQDDGDRQDAPAPLTFCDHCNLCLTDVALALAPTIGSVRITISPVVHAGILTSDATPRGPPRWSSSPRAPPIFG